MGKEGAKSGVLFALRTAATPLRSEGTNGGPRPAIEALAARDSPTADRAEWMLVQAGPSVLPEVRKALRSEDPALRRRAVRIVAWQGDTTSLEALRAMQKTNAQDAALAAWAIQKIQALHPGL